jgi:hypothetical protein
MERFGKYGTQTVFYFVIPKAGSTDLAATGDWTPATGDTKISKDGGNFANTTNNPAAVGGTGSVGWSLTLTATEMQAAVIVVQFVDSATKAITDNALLIYTFGNASAKWIPDLSDGVRMGLTALPNAAAEAAGGLFTRGTGAGQINQAANGNVDVNAVKQSGTTLTARDMGASVLLSPGTGTGQLDITSGVVKANDVQILGTAISTPATAGILDVNLKNIANAAVSTTTAQLGVNAVQISGDSVAADNCEADYDGTGYAGGTIVKQADVTKLLGTAWLTPGVAGTPDVNVKLISADSVAADNLESFCDGTGYAGTNNVIPTVTTSGLSAAAVDAVWDEPVAGHATAASFGKYLDSDISADAATSAAVTAAVIADAVWDEAKSGHTTNTTFGDLATDVDAAVTDIAAVHVHAGTIETDVAAVHVHVGTIDGHITADYGATEKSAIDLLDDAYTGTMHAAIADAIWEEAKSGHTTSTTMGDIGQEGFTVSVGTGAGQVNVASGKVPATIAAGDLATDSLTADALKADAVTEIVHGVLDHAVSAHLTAGTIGNLIASLGGKMTVTGNQLIVYSANNSTELFRFNLTDASTNPTMTDVYTRTVV